METGQTITEQVAYYRALAPEYDDHAIDVPGRAELVAALDRFGATGNVLELACGPGTWTPRLLRTATTVTAVDASPDMLGLAAARVGDAPIRFIEADVLSWRPDRRYEAVVFGFWISHVPEDRFDSFWALVADCLEPGGRVFFMDDHHRTEAELVEGEASPVVERRLNDGTAFRVIKVPWKAPELEARLHDLGWDISVTATAGPFYWGEGTHRSG